jgi:hypothetical protein
VEEVERNQTEYIAPDRDENMMLEASAEDLEILKLVAFFSKKSILQKNVSPTSKSSPLGLATPHMDLPPPVIFRRKKTSGFEAAMS